MIQFSSYFINGFNCLILGCFFLYLIIKKIVPSYQKQIDDETKAHQEQINMVADFEKKKHQLIALNSDQEDHIAQLQEKISHWRASVDSEQERIAKFSKQRHDQIHEKRVRLSHEIGEKKVQREALAKSILDAKKQMELIFSNKSAQEAYLTRLCAYNSKKGF